MLNDLKLCVYFLLEGVCIQIGSFLIACFIALFRQIRGETLFGFPIDYMFAVSPVSIIVVHAIAVYFLYPWRNTLELILYLPACIVFFLMRMSAFVN